MKTFAEIKEERSLSLGTEIEVFYKIEVTVVCLEGQLSFDVSHFEFVLDAEDCESVESHEVGYRFLAVVEKLVLKSLEKRIETMTTQPEWQQEDM